MGVFVSLLNRIDMADKGELEGGLFDFETKVNEMEERCLYFGAFVLKHSA